MFVLLKMAARNILRNKRRSLITLIGIGLGLGLILIFNGFITGSEDQLVNNFIASQGGHIQINAEGYAAKARLMPMDIVLKEPDALAQRIARLPHVTQVLKRVRFGAGVSNEIDTLPSLALGIDPAPERDGIIAKSLIAGRYEDFVSQPRAALVGKTLAEDLQLKVDSDPDPNQTADITLVVRTSTGSTNALAPVVKGIFYTGFPQLDSMVVVPLPEAQRRLLLKEQVTDLIVTVDDVGRTESVAAAIRQALENGAERVEVQTWRDLGQALWQLLTGRRYIFGILSGIVIIIAALGMMNTILMSVFERTREIGTMMALGVTRAEVQVLFLLESMLLGGAGALMGTFIGGSITKYFSINGIATGDSVGSLTSVPVGQMIYSNFSWSSIGLFFAMVLLLSIVAAAYPAYLASRQEPVQALRYV
jgi:putative ABC transport system permease protein